MDLITKIKSKMATGKPLEQIKDSLIQEKKWSTEELFNAFHSIAPASNTAISLKSSMTASGGIPSTNGKTGHKTLIIILIILALLVLGGYGVYLYLQNKLKGYMDLAAENYTQLNQVKEAENNGGKASGHVYQNTSKNFFVDISDSVVFPLSEMQNGSGIDMYLFTKSGTKDYRFMVLITKDQTITDKLVQELSKVADKKENRNVNGVNFDYYHVPKPIDTSTYITQKDGMTYLVQSQYEIDYINYFGFLK